MKKWLFAFVVILLGTFVSMASGIDGKWKATMKGPDGSMEIVFVFKVDGNKLTGTVTTPMGEMAISEGKFDGKEISFNLDMNGNPIPHKGTLEKDVIKMKMVGGPGKPAGGDSNAGAPPDGGETRGGGPKGGGPGEMTLKRVVE
jgi:hypothetical protein